MDGGSRATDDLNRSKYGITDQPVGHATSTSSLASSLAITDY